MKTSWNFNGLGPCNHRLCEKKNLIFTNLFSILGYLFTIFVVNDKFGVCFNTKFKFFVNSLIEITKFLQCNWYD